MIHKYLSIALIAVALVVIIPIVYGAVEPSVIINLESGQFPIGTKPFQIEDSLGTEVFSVSPDGSYRSSNLFVFHYEQEELVTLPNTLKFPLILELAVWEIVRDPSFVRDYPALIIYDSAVYGQQKALNASCSCIKTGFFKSENTTFSATGMHWKAIDPLTTGTVGVFVADLELDISNILSTDVNFIAFGSTNNILGKTGEFKEFSGSQTIHFPMGVTIKRIL